jgi:hypothetical protein
MSKILGWFLGLLIPSAGAFFFTLILDILIALGFSSIAFVGFELLIDDVFKIVDTMLRGVIPLNSMAMVEAAGFFLALRIYFAAISTRLAIFIYFKMMRIGAAKRKAAASGSPPPTK